MLRAYSIDEKSIEKTRIVSVIWEVFIIYKVIMNFFRA